MVVIAVAGGTGSVGQTIVDAFEEDGKHTVVVLARKVPEGSGVPVFAVDYNNVEQTTKTLEENNIHTVISTIVMRNPEAGEAEINLVTAAARSSATKRFVASNWGNATPAEKSLQLSFNVFRYQTIEALRQTNLEWTQVHNGLYLDYYGIPHIESHLTPLSFAVDIANRVAAIPGTTGDETLALTYTKDLGKFVVAAQSLPKWEQALHCYSDFATLRQIVQIAEEVTGSKFDITYDPVEKLQRGEITELPSHTTLYPYFPKHLLSGLLSIFGLWVINGIMYVPKEGSLNEKFPEIRTTTVKEVVSVWKGN